jgi:hypothetical protein
MDIQASIEQVAGILVREKLAFQTHDDGCSYRLLFGEDAVFIHFSAWHDRIRVYLTAPALQDIDPAEAGGAVVVAKLNELNRSHRFAKWLFDDGTLLAVHDLLGDDLQKSELLNAVYALASAATAVAEELADETGGIRYAEACGIELEVEDE